MRRNAMYFNKILVADRSDAACRVIRTCMGLRIQTVAIFTEQESNALHADMANEAYAVTSYSNAQEVMQIARQTGAEAIHPGYGWFSENPLFVRQCIDAGFVFIGPSPRVLLQMGNKIKAKNAAKRAGVPVLPGSESLAYEEEQAILIAAHKIGFPAIVKAAWGGGGRAMEIAETEAELLATVRSIRGMAERFFSEPDLYLEKLVRGGRHIEIQVERDMHGTCFHSRERDCSVQRRRAKIVEEAPAPGLNKRLRRKLCSWAVKLVSKIGYVGVGTVEFLVSPEGKAYFIEMNPRLQVEHGVTEMREGIDLVEVQLAIAAGKKLSTQKKERYKHVMEVRIYTDTFRNGIFSPAIGKVIINKFPEPASFLRIDSALRQGQEIECTVKDEDAALICKLIVGASSREQAIERMIAALRDLRIEGVTGREILLAILHWDSFRKNIHALDTLNNRSVTQEIERAAHRFTLEKGLYPSLGRIAGDVAHEVL